MIDAFALAVDLDTHVVELIDQLRAKRALDEGALEKLISGKSTTMMQDQTGERIQYTKADMSALERQIEVLSEEIARRTRGGGFRGPIRLSI